MGPIGCTETLVWSYHSSLRKIPEERRSHLRGGESVKSRSVLLFAIFLHNNLNEQIPSVESPICVCVRVVFYMLHISHHFTDFDDIWNKWDSWNSLWTTYRCNICRLGMHVLIPCCKQCQHDVNAKMGEDGTNSGSVHSRIVYLSYVDIANLGFSGSWGRRFKCIPSWKTRIFILTL